MISKHKASPSFEDHAVGAELERRRNRLLVELLDQLDVEYGPVDESLIEKYARLLQGHDSRTVLDIPRLPGDDGP